MRINRCGFSGQPCLCCYVGCRRHKRRRTREHVSVDITHITFSPNGNTIEAVARRRHPRKINP